MYQIEINFNDNWVRVPGMFESRDKALWAITMWKKDNFCTGDKFWRIVPPIAG